MPTVVAAGVVRAVRAVDREVQLGGVADAGDRRSGPTRRPWSRPGSARAGRCRRTSPASSPAGRSATVNVAVVGESTPANVDAHRERQRACRAGSSAASASVKSRDAVAPGGEVAVGAARGVTVGRASPVRHRHADAGRRAVADVGDRQRSVARLPWFEVRVAVAGRRRDRRLLRPARAAAASRPVYSSTLSARRSRAGARVDARGREVERGGVNASRTSAIVAPGCRSSTSAAIAAACGAAAEVPKNGSKSGTEVVTPSAAVSRASGARLRARVTRRRVKNTRRGPSEVKRSGGWAAVNTPGNGPRRVRRVARLEVEGERLAAGAAATLKASRPRSGRGSPRGSTQAGRPSAAHRSGRAAR